MIKEGRVLFRVQHLEQSARWVTVVSAADLVNLVNKYQRVLGSYTLERLNDLARKCSARDILSAFTNVFQVCAYIPDVCASVTLDFRNVGQTSNGEAEELAVQSTGDRLADRRLTNTRGPNQANDFALDGATKLPDSEELQDAILDVLEAVVILVQNGQRVRDRVVLRRMTTPRNLRKGRASVGKSSHDYARRTCVSHSK